MDSVDTWESVSYLDLTQPRDEATLTDIYGRRINKRVTNAALPIIQDDEVEVDKEQLNLVRRLQGSLSIPKKVEEPKGKDEQEVLTYAETLHRGLKIMWIPMVYLGRMPFRLLLKRGRASIVVNKCSPAYLSCFTTCILTWLIFLWVTTGCLTFYVTSIILMLGKSSPAEKALFGYYWSDLFIFWTTMLQACISSTHILYQADDFALFIKDWYRVLDISKIEVSRTLKRYIIINQIILCVFILAMIAMFLFPKIFIGVRGTTVMIVIALREPIQLASGNDRNKQSRVDIQLASVGLLVYLMVIVFSWMYMMQFMVFCRCFRKGLKCVNQRIAMILNVDDVPRVGPNALRLTYEYIHKDHLGIVITGIKIGRIFSWTVCNYYLWAVLVLVVELGEIFRSAKADRRQLANPVPVSQNDDRTTNLLADLNKQDIAVPVQQLINNMLHFITTSICLFYISYEGSGAHNEGKISYELARYRGLVDCTTQLERNFIRSIWIIVSEKCPVHIAPGKFFGITHSTIMTVFATAFTYFIFWAQSQGQFHYGYE